ncbi:hypothetical protein QJS10_CPB15g02022 [Acorus calamus]|uniref:Uncharacterized protein n=1 Tax=Acorus calamus TaxID=4465 RepID=A0AAV9D5F9_ACOCL|nr:hypothetical protein QJS10_CPB15g02022 [Acorus calamus]
MTWQWENAVAGGAAGFAPSPPSTLSTSSVRGSKGFRGLYAGFYPAVFGSTVSWGLYFFFYNRAKQRYSKHSGEELSPGLHLASAAEGGALVCLFTNPIWLVKTRLQLQTPLHQNRTYSGFSDALRTILKEEGWHALYKGLGPGLLLVSHGAIQFTVYEELRKVVIHLRRKEQKENSNDDKLLVIPVVYDLNSVEIQGFVWGKLLEFSTYKGNRVVFSNSVDYAMLGASSKFSAILLTYPYQQRPGSDGIPKYMNSWHVIKDTFRKRGLPPGWIKTEYDTKEKWVRRNPRFLSGHDIQPIEKCSCLVHYFRRV